MKKIKSLKTLSSLASVAVVTPVVATACNDNEITKTNIDTFTWSEKGDYNFIMTKDEVIDTFKSNNKTIKEGGDLPDDIYDNVELSTYLASDFWAVYILADDTSSKYTGFINVYVDTQKVNIDTLDWSNEGEYLATLTPDVAKAEFISKNKTQAECGTLPDDIYDNVDITAVLNNDSWYFTIITKSTSKRYFGSETKDTSATKVNIDKFNWSIIGDYNVLMSNDEISNKFQLLNPAGKNNLPYDIYDYVKIETTGDMFRREVTISIDDVNEKYVGSTKLTPFINGIAIYNDTGYPIANKIDINRLCGQNTLLIPLEDGTFLNVEDHSLLTQLYISPMNTTNEINDDFLCNFPNLNTFYIDKINSITKIGNNFLNNCSSLASFDTSSFTNAITIGDYFMYNCASLDKVDLSKFSALESIGEHFLDGCKNLTELDFSNISWLTSIPNNFLNNCNFETLDFSSLTNVKTIGDDFLLNCNKLTSVNLANLTLVEKIGKMFLGNCTSLEAIDLSSWTNLVEIGSGFLSNCEKMLSANLPNGGNITTIGDDFMKDCKSLPNLDLTSIFKNITKIPSNFLSGCANLKTFCMSGLEDVTSVGANFLSGCTNLKDVDISGWTNASEIQDGFLSGFTGSLNMADWTSMTTLDNVKFPDNLGSLNLSGWTSMTEVKQSWFPDNLKELNLSGWASLKRIINAPFFNVNKISFSGSDIEWIPTNFLSEGSYHDHYCYWKIINLNGLIHLTSIGTYAFNCWGNTFNLPPSITYINLCGSSNIDSIGGYFAYWLTTLDAINLTGLTKLRTIDDRFIGMDGGKSSRLFSLDFSSLTSIESVGEKFLLKNDNLHAIDFSGFVNLNSAGDDWMNGWDWMDWLKLPAFKDGTLAAEVDDHFNDDGDFENGLFVVPKGEGTKWHNYFADDGDMNGEVIEQGKGYMTYANENYLLNDNIDPNIFCGDGDWVVPTNKGDITIKKANRNSIITFALPDTISPESIGDDFLNDCANLAFVDLSALSNTTDIGNNFLRNNPMIMHLDCTPLTNVKTIGSGFLSGCSKLGILDLSPMTSVTNVGTGFLSNCPELINLTVFNKDPNDIVMDEKDFINSINKYCWTIHAGDYVEQYKVKDPWSIWADHIEK